MLQGLFGTGLKTSGSRHWLTQFRITAPKGRSGLNEMELRIVAREKITVPAGTFNTFRNEGRGVFEMGQGIVEVTNLTKWMAPDEVRREIALEQTREVSGRGGGGRRGAARRPGPGGRSSTVVQSVRWEQISFKQS